MKKHIVISTALTIALFLSTHAVWNAAGRYIEGRQHWDATMEQSRALKERYRQLSQQQPVLAQLKKFVDQAKAFDLVKDRWAYYPVTIDTAVSFPAAEQILNQTAPSDAYYFKPSMLHIKKKPEQNHAGHNDAEGLHQDLFLTLKGSFVVRQHDR